ncbi:MAG: class II aldolase/adducin family protein [Bacteroidota bacterium]
MDEGYIKYQLHWQEAEALPTDLLQDLIRWRKEMYDRNWIGYDQGLKVGFGNLSEKCDQQLGHFIISGTQTGHLQDLSAEHFTAVSSYDISANQLICRGPVKASSESLTHAGCYELSKRINAVIHIHNRPLWQWMCGRLPTTAEDVAYGTPEMAFEVKRLYEKTVLPQQGVFAMAGHQDGIVSFGESLSEAAKRLFDLHQIFSHA